VLAEALGRATGRKFARAPAADVHGGSINRCVRWDTEAGPVFVKIAADDRAGMFEAEAAGLRELSGSGTVRVPRVLATVVAGREAALAMEWLDLGSPSSADQAMFGRQLAALHRTTGREFGWHRDNTIGSTPQANALSTDWPRFYAERRLGFQLRLARSRGLDPRVVERGHRLAAACASFFTTYRPVPSLLHGDLWGGNWAALRDAGGPVTFDPAVYYGDREADLAMTRLFGGFGPAFYAAYEDAWPLDAGATTRRTLYDLYHVLNHYNLFGGGYGAQAAGMIDRLLAEVRA
jgi:fructosamine-3-kinase